MADIHLERAHHLGLARARELAREWAQEAERSFEMVCTLVEGAEGDTVEFARSGVKGVLRVDAGSFTLDARLGLLLGAFSRKIEAEIEKNLDRLLQSPGTA